jgi:hypothetical protein
MAWQKASEKLFEIPAVGVARGVVRQKAKDKQPNKEEDNNINSNLEGQHINASNQQVLLKIGFIIIQKHDTFWANEPS